MKPRVLDIKTNSLNLYKTREGFVNLFPITFTPREGSKTVVQVGFKTQSLGDDYNIVLKDGLDVVEFKEDLDVGVTVTIRRVTPSGFVPHTYHYTGNSKGQAEFNSKTIDENFQYLSDIVGEVEDNSAAGDYRLDLLEDSFKDVTDVSNDALKVAKEADSKVEGAYKAAMDAVEASNNVVDTAQESLDNSKLALSLAKGVDGKAQEALDKSTIAVKDSAKALGTALTIDGKAQEALDKSKEAKASADTAVTLVQGVDGKAQEALDTSNKTLADLDTKRDLDDNVFHGALSVISDNDKHGTGVFLQEADGSVRGSLVSNSYGVQVMQRQEDGSAQTFTFPRYGQGGELLTKEASRDLSSIDFRKNLHRKKVVLTLPINPKEVRDWITTSAFPQNFTIHEGQVWVATGAPTHVIVYDFKTGGFITAFKADDSPWTCEGIAVQWRGSVRWLYLRGRDDTLVMYDVTKLPSNGSIIKKSSAMDGYRTARNFDVLGDSIITSSITAPIGFDIHRGMFNLYTHRSLAPVGTLKLNPLLFGIVEKDMHAGTTPKTQGICLTPDGLVAAFGGLYRKGAPFNEYGIQGIGVYTMDGTEVVRTMYDPVKYHAKMEEIGLRTDRCENEGVSFYEGKIYSLLVGNASPTAYDAIHIVEEFSDSPDAVDFSDCAIHYNKVFEDGWLNKDLISPFTNKPYDTLEELMQIMRSLNVSYVNYYSSSVKLKRSDGTFIPNGNLVEVYNGNNRIFSVVFGVAASSKVTRCQYTSQDDGSIIETKVSE